ncbi:DNA polymerase III subunit beta [Thaumasiovibrio subtropicus]|uniref:DNA polymerase III subunit beta n=1 Tax=Thaumasiovibrio subtropicus TaxID=1891207 RepID=UPI000B3539B1|nr:DNA polymerase III subunit beta [Thaumasiovibrio subtropicus]
MKVAIERSRLLKPLQQVSGALGGRPSLPILGNVLVQVSPDGMLSLTGTDLEVELIGQVQLEGEFQPGETTIPSRKFLDICRGLPDGVNITLTLEGDRLIIRSGRSRYSLATLPARDFPNIEDWQSEVEFALSQTALRRLIESTQFSMANQDVRYYLNGMLVEVKGSTVRTVATDGHRMAVCQAQLAVEAPEKQVIVPRKGILELVRLLEHSDEQVMLQIGGANIRTSVNGFVFTSKLVDGRFPDYQRVMPQSSDKTVVASCETLKQAFSRAAILSNEKFRGVRVNLESGQMRISANNPEQEEAEEFVDVDYEGDALEIGFNVSYVLDVLNTLKCDEVKLMLTDANASALIEDVANDDASYVVMPIRL